MQIDLNCDLGEGCPLDAELMPLITSANIACGFHAGGPDMALATIQLAAHHHVAIGAHPSFPDRANFGRVEMVRTEQQVFEDCVYQIGALAGLARAAGLSLSHVKPHGALYNQAARDPLVAEAVVAAIRDFDPSLAVFGLASSVLVDAARRAGLVAVEEVFADRGYRADGSLVPRSQPGALVDDEGEVIARTLDMVRERRVRAVTGEWVPLNAQTVCLHGDGPHAVAFAQRIRAALEAAGVDVIAPPHCGDVSQS